MSYKQLIKSCLISRQEKSDRIRYSSLLKANGYANNPCELESEWLNKWAKLGVAPTKECYRLFSHYIGNDVNIVPEFTCHHVVEKILNPVEMTGYYTDKQVYDRLFPKGYFPTTIYRSWNGGGYNADYQYIGRGSKPIDIALNNSTHSELIIKPTLNTESGRGVLKAVRKSYDSWELLGNPGVNIDGSYLLNYYCDRDFIIQECAQQSDVLSRFNPTSVNTLRLSVYRSVNDEKCHVTAAIMRIGCEGSYVDNAHQGGMFVGIKSDGMLCNRVCNQYGHTEEVFNGIDFKQNLNIPNYERIKQFACSVGQYIPHCRLLALDIVLLKDGTPQLIEFNVDPSSYSMWLFQFTVGPAFGQYADEIIDYCASNLKKVKYYFNPL